MDDAGRQWIAQVCRETRERTGFRRSDVASDIGREGDAIRNFETLRGGWNPQFGAIVESYAARGNTTSLALWTEALSRWRASQLQAQPEQGSHTEQRKVDETRTPRIKPSKVRSGSQESPEQANPGRQRKASQ